MGKLLKEAIITGGWLNTSWFMLWLVAKHRDSAEHTGEIVVIAQHCGFVGDCVIRVAGPVAMFVSNSMS